MVAAGERKPVRTSRHSDSSRRPRHPVAQLAACAVDAMAERKAQNITVMDLRGISGAVADYFVVGTGGSDRQIRAVANAVDEHLEEQCDERPWHTEGLEHLQWVLLDYVDLVVHVFSEEKRAYYDLERLWGDARIEHVPEDGSAADVEMLRPAHAEEQADS